MPADEGPRRKLVVAQQAGDHHHHHHHHHHDDDDLNKLQLRDLHALEQRAFAVARAGDIGLPGGGGGGAVDPHQAVHGRRGAVSGANSVCLPDL